jgi:hypothetical protein
MSFWVLFSVFHYCFENSCILSHYCGFKTDFYICVFMRKNFNVFREYLKSKLLCLFFTSFFYFKFDSARYFVKVSDFEFFDNSIGTFRREKSPKQECFFFNRKDIGVDHGSHLLSTGGHNNLLFENRFEIFSNDSWNAGFSDELVKTSIWLIIRISSLYIYSYFLFVEFLGISNENYFHVNAALRRNTSEIRINSPNTSNSQSRNIFFSFFGFFFDLGWFVVFFGIFLSFSVSHVHSLQ